MAGYPLEQNPNWRGGRSVASNGYVLIKRPSHRAADSRGYVYEHRLVMEQVLGRGLLASEQVHHINHDKTDNRPENLVVTSSQAQHAAKHRKRTDLRDPGESNSSVDCGCGCGAVFPKYDAEGRPRRFITGHNMFKRQGSI